MQKRYFHVQNGVKQVEKRKLNVDLTKGQEAGKISGDFRFEFEYVIKYKNDFSILVFRLHVNTTHTHLIHDWATIATLNQHEKRGLWKHPTGLKFENRNRTQSRTRSPM